MKNMKNKLIPLTPCSSNPSEYEPSLVSDGFKFRHLVDDHQGFSFRRDLMGLVREVGGLPIVQLDDGGVYAVQHPTKGLLSCW
jgi:hypothetical protein